VLDDPKKNTKKYLEDKISRLCPLSDKELKELSKKAEEKKVSLESEEIEEIKKKHYVK